MEGKKQARRMKGIGVRRVKCFDEEGNLVKIVKRVVVRLRY